MDNFYYIPKRENKFLNLERPLVFFDLETTGPSTANDQIIELSAVKLSTDVSQEENHYLINPTIPIAAGATAVQGYP